MRTVPHASSRIKAGSCALAAALLACIACNRIPNASREESLEYTPGSAYPHGVYPYQIAFNPMPDDTVELCGTRVCTLTVGGEVSTITPDSVIMRTVALPETVIEFDGTCYGHARFEKTDFNYPGGLYSNIMSFVNNDTGGVRYRTDPWTPRQGNA
jgi:hypothetical protein